MIHDTAIDTSFLLTPSGHVALVFDDANFVRAEQIIFHSESGELGAILHHQYHVLGHLSGKLKQAFAAQTQVSLSSLRSDGSLLDLTAEIIQH